MPTLHCLSFPTHSSPTPIPNNDNINLSSSLNPPKPLQQNSTNLSLPLPNLSSDTKQKILSLEILGIDSTRALALHPNLLTTSSDSIHQVISFLLSKGIHHKDLSRILNICPIVLTLSITKHLVPVFNFLSRELKLHDSEFRHVIRKCPRFLTSNVHDQLRPTLIYLQKLGFKDVTLLALHDPVVFVSSVENTIMPKLEYLVGIGLRREDVVGMVLRCPSLLTFSIENNFKLKYEYFVKEMGGGLEEIKEFPQYFAFSLEKRIKVRHREMVEMGRRLPLSSMLKSADCEFKELLVQRDDPGNCF